MSIVTADRQTHRFEVTEVGDGVVRGRAESVPVDQVVSLEIRRFGPDRTLGLILGIALIAGLAALAAAASHPGINYH